MGIQFSEKTTSYLPELLAKIQYGAVHFDAWWLRKGFSEDNIKQFLKIMARKVVLKSVANAHGYSDGVDVTSRGWGRLVSGIRNGYFDFGFSTYGPDDGWEARASEVLKKLFELAITQSGLLEQELKDTFREDGWEWDGNSLVRSNKNGGKRMTMQINQGVDVDQVWGHIKAAYDINKMQFAKKISFVKNKHVKNIIFRDIAHSYFCLTSALHKPAVILAGGVAEELLRLYLDSKGHLGGKGFNEYIQICKKHSLLKGGVASYTDGLRDFRNFVHLKKEATKKHTISKATATAAFGTIFTLSNDFV